MAIDLQRVFSSPQLTPEVVHHLRNVYTTLGMTLMAAAVGSFLYMTEMLVLSPWVFLIVDIGCLLGLLMSPHNRKNVPKRMAMLIGCGACSGYAMGPLLNFAAYLDPSLIPNALLATAVVFFCFTMASLLAKDRKFLYMGGFLFSMVSTLLVLRLANIFFRSSVVFSIELYGGLFLFCAFVLFDTQLIILKRQIGDDDYIRHAFELFVDVVEIFRALLQIMAAKEQRKKKNNRD